MNKDKIIWIVFVLFAVIALGVLAFFVFKNDNSDQNANQSISQIQKKIPSDSDNFASAVYSKNIDDCDKIKSEKMKENCKQAITDIHYYNQALATLDESFCEAISVADQISACLLALRSKEAYLRENYPDELEAIYIRNKNLNRIELLTEKTEADASDIDSFLSLALAYAEKALNDQAMGGSQDEYVEKAFEAVASAEQLDPENSEVFRVKAYIYEIEPHYENAKDNYTKAIELDSENFKAYAGRGHSNRMLGLLDNAVEDLETASELDDTDKHSFIYSNLCNLYVSKGEFEKAKLNCQKVISNESSDSGEKMNAYRVLSSIDLRNMNLIGARENLEEALLMAPMEASLYVAFSKLSIYEKDYDSSVDYARKAVDINTNQAGNHLTLAQALYMQEKYEESIGEAERAIELVSSDVSILLPEKESLLISSYYQISFDYREMGDSSKQAEYEEKAKELLN
ncbi:hypothetical protein C0583_02395 [Candidatus Parcubacteria bacterium]|mgnify:CR=1 FL=1|nr:MAG: hypothetical protein C0583_02395 [Candidatus Parcubacteria bacterium]